MLTSKELKTLEPFLEDINRECTFRELKGQAKSNNATQRSIRKFLDRGLLTERKVGNLKLYRLGQPAFIWLELYMNENLQKPVQLSMNILRRELVRTGSFFSIIIFGSYANSTQKKDSDLDVAVIVPQDNDDIRVAVGTASRRSILKLHPHIISEKDFRSMLSADYPNLVKEIRKNNRPTYNAEAFYMLYATLPGQG
jgi:predicted nucleotidyltransferase